MSQKSQSGYSRRDFLKIVGATTGVAAVGCAELPVEKLVPYVNQPNEVIPGIALWYAGTCGECDAGCGLLVRTREGRAVKIEGNPFHPVNRGGVCALGHSALQTHYDPDRIREPLRRDLNGAFKTASWPDAIDEISKALAGLQADDEAVIVTGDVSSSTAALIKEFTAAFPRVRHQTYSLFGRDIVDLAAERCFGEGVRTQFNFANAQVLVNFGADFLETWVSPVQYARQWSETRRPNAKQEISYFAHFEPRLSLTAANADRWVMNRAGSELPLMLALLKLVSEKKGGGKLSASQRAAVQKLVAGIDVNKVAEHSGVSTKILEMLAGKLASAEQSLVLAGGAATAGATAVDCAVVANIFNVMLGNVGSTVLLTNAASGGAADGIKAGSSHEQMAKLISDLSAEKSKVKVLIFANTNPAFSLPSATGFVKAVGKAKFVASMSTQLDETTALANVVLPASTNFESWSDSEPLPGVYSLNQPSMQPLYQTQSLGDSLLSIAAKLDKKFKEATSFQEYIQARWKERTGASDFEARWTKFVETGGDFEKAKFTPVSAELREAAVAVEIATAATKLIGTPRSEAALALMAFPTIASKDGSSANRPWLQELPDPLSQVTWGSWAEIHPTTAARLGYEQGSVVQLKTEFGSIELPLFVTKYVHPEVIAVPIGQGHQSFGRYADGVGVNVLSVLSGTVNGGSVSMIASQVTVNPSIGDEKLAIVQWQNSQEGREIIRERAISSLHQQHAKDGEHGSGHGAAHSTDSHSANSHSADPLLALAATHDYTDIEHRPQMYKQMEYPKYRWGMTIDMSTCTGCSACVVSCYAENNISIVGKEQVLRGREMTWIRMDRYLDGPDHRPVGGFQPFMCQHCGNAPCEPVCPVYATYHNEEGLNSMVYNRCVGTRYCSNNCSYKVRRFNWYRLKWPEPLTWQLNPDVTVREVGVMEKCSLCVQRIREADNRAKNLGREILDGEIQPACASSCPTRAITFGNLLDKTTEVSRQSADARAYRVLDAEYNTQPGISYLVRLYNDNETQPA